MGRSGNVAASSYSEGADDKAVDLSNKGIRGSFTTFVVSVLTAFEWLDAADSGIIN